MRDASNAGRRRTNLEDTRSWQRTWPHQALVVIALTLFWMPVQSAAQSPAITRVLTGGVLIDGTGAGPREATIVIRGSVIETVSDTLPEDLPAAAKIVDLGGRFVIPGLVEAHTHLATNPAAPDYETNVRLQLRQLLGSGITDVRDMGGDARVLVDLDRQVEANEIPGPDIYFSAILGGARLFSDQRIAAGSVGFEPGTAPWAHVVAEDTDLDALMEQISDLGATGVKIYGDLGPELVEQISTAARSRDLMVWSHWVIAPRRTAGLDALRAGVQVVSHAFMLMMDATPAQRASAAEVIAAAGGTALFQEMRDRGIVLDATLAASAQTPAPPEWASPRSVAAAITRDAYAAGVLIVAGSDRPASDGIPAIHSEYELLVEDAGLSPQQAMETATRIGAMVLGISARRGTIEAGKEATMLILDLDPTTSVRHWREPAYVLKRGVIYSGANLREEGTPIRPLSSIPQR